MGERVVERCIYSVFRRENCYIITTYLYILHLGQEVGILKALGFVSVGEYHLLLFPLPLLILSHTMERPANYNTPRYTLLKF